MGCDQPQTASAESSICPLMGRNRLLVTRSPSPKQPTVTLPTLEE
jgi:hypothetical protein